MSWDNEGDRPHLLPLASDEDGDEYIIGPAPDQLQRFGLGPCCICGDWDTVGIVTMPITAPVPGTGWGCLVCDQPANGAYAVLCEKHSDQLDAGEIGYNDIQQVVYGWATRGQRIPISDYSHEEFGHDLRYHQGEVRTN